MTGRMVGMYSGEFKVVGFVVWTFFFLIFLGFPSIENMRWGMVILVMMNSFGRLDVHLSC